MEKEIMANEDVMVVAEEITPDNSVNGLVVAAVVAGAGLVGYGIYKLVKFIKAKRAPKTELAVNNLDTEDVFEHDLDEE